MAQQDEWIDQVAIVMPEEVVLGSLRIERGQIAEIRLADNRGTDGNSPGERGYVWQDGMYLLPGLIDIHCDAIEKEVQPRPNTLFPMEMALLELERKLAGNGITTMYHSLSLGTGLSLRGEDLVTKMIRLIRCYRQEQAMIRHRIHLRYEVIYLDGLPLAEELVRSGQVEYLSYMNHAPGQGQYRAPGSFEAYVMKNQGVNKEEVRRIAENALQKQEQIDWERLRYLAEEALADGIALASHDDDTLKKVDEARSFGASVSEFPLNLETAQYAKQRGLQTCVGAPNVVRGGSHDNNMKAMDGIRAGAVDILCSDYYPSSMLSAIVRIADEAGIGIARATAMATLHPAKAVGIDDCLGSIEVGKQADLILIQMKNGYPLVRKTWVNGLSVYEANYYRQNEHERQAL
ncbi:alpha-D-ribose 1-methylphosphonate 5-triphosphate diphosphatase [Paenibacillus sp. J2TS4]|uniref:alpha-D-ribose 1-methylphosphonate 5-triphosphate diphosphatase n=1 Tax=Paenibacillus sp. J2TS4 TaxID=2807194 RepID=UPI001B0C2246|nr:alpha-D-ribose 1-methylphosphonate 5-triphosphate diphosphatase [Paenibacillus sp. J2TS4]GIP32225.1 alpha-D-ribose 1-methylphosphonate 5-triphosphate diphosphatase [Paenibacillus sp. J2TS4]